MRLARISGARRVEFILTTKIYFGHLVIPIVMNVMVEVVEKELKIYQITGSPPMMMKDTRYHGPTD